MTKTLVGAAEPPIPAAVAAALDALLASITEAGEASERARAAQAVVAASGRGGAVRRAIARSRRDAVNELRAEGRSLGEIAALLGVSRGTVQQISEGKQTGRAVFPRR